MFNVIRNIKTQANEAVIAAQAATKGLNFNAKEFNEEQDLAIRKAFMGLKEARDQMTTYGSNLLKRIIRWIFCGKIVNQVNKAISDILPYRASTRTFKEAKNSLDEEIKKMKVDYRGAQREEFEQALMALTSDIYKSIEATVTEIDDLADLLALGKLTEDELEDQGEKLTEALEAKLIKKFKALLEEFDQEYNIRMPNL